MDSLKSSPFHNSQHFPVDEYNFLVLELNNIIGHIRE
jgi:hypothetical protein